MLTTLTTGARCTLRADSEFAGQGDNPPAGALGTLDHFTDGWAVVSWDSDPTRPLNYRPHDLDAAA